jgi:hypothetical protein
MSLTPVFMLLRNLFVMQNPNDYPNNYQCIDHEIKTLNTATGVTAGDVTMPPANVLIRASRIVPSSRQISG